MVEEEDVDVVMVTGSMVNESPTGQKMERAVELYVGFMAALSDQSKPSATLEELPNQALSPETDPGTDMKGREIVPVPVDQCADPDRVISIPLAWQPCFAIEYETTSLASVVGPVLTSKVCSAWVEFPASSMVREPDGNPPGAPRVKRFPALSETENLPSPLTV
jgi:hypothetical protein